MDAGQKKVVLDDEQVEEMDKMADFVVSIYDNFYNISQQNEKIALALYKKGCLEIADDLAVQAENMAEQEIKKENLKND